LEHTDQAHLEQWRVRPLSHPRSSCTTVSYAPFDDASQIKMVRVHPSTTDPRTRTSDTSLPLSHNRSMRPSPWRDSPPCPTLYSPRNSALGEASDTTILMVVYPIGAPRVLSLGCRTQRTEKRQRCGNNAIGIWYSCQGVHNARDGTWCDVECDVETKLQGLGLRADREGEYAGSPNTFSIPMLRAFIGRRFQWLIMLSSRLQLHLLKGYIWHTISTSIGQRKVIPVSVVVQPVVKAGIKARRNGRVGIM
jgi:hypothetical protein